MKQVRNLDTKLHFKTVIISDLHLGSPYSQLEKIIDFLHSIQTETLILNGDFIDGWSLFRKGGWSNRCTRVIRIILDKIRDEKTRVIYVRGNHDDFLDKMFPLSFEGIEVISELEYPTREGTYLITHGDGFDSVTSQHKWLALVGDVGYQIMMKSNAWYNTFQPRFDWPKFSISQWTKAKVKSVVAFVDQYEQQLQDLARQRNYRGIICGHIHTPADKKIGEFRYLNSGDWVESNTAIVEHFEGDLEVVDYFTFQKWKRGAQKGDCMVAKLKNRESLDFDLDLASS